MTTPEQIEAMFLHANGLLERGKLGEGKQLLEEIILIEPRFGRAFCHLGRLYERDFKAFEKAERFYHLAVKFSPDYAPTYINLIEMLLDLNRLPEAQMMIGRARPVPGVEAAQLDYLMGCLMEMRGLYRQAARYYKQARQQSMNTCFMMCVDGALFRTRRKAGRLAGMALGFF